MVVLPTASRVATVQFWMAVGVAHEPAHASGTAHLLEHLLVSAANEDERLFDLGASVRGTTTHDACMLGTKVAATEATVAIDALARAFEHRIDPTTLALERRVLSREIGHHRSSTIESKTRARMAGVFGAGHPYARPVAGEHDGIAKLTLSDVEALRAHHTATRLTIVVVGAVDPHALHVPEPRLGEGHADIVFPEPTPTAGSGGSMATVPAVRAGHPAAEALERWAWILDRRLGGFGRGWARLWTAREAGLLLLSGTDAWGEAERLREEGPDPREVDAAIADLVEQRARTLGSPTETATRLGRSACLDLPEGARPAGEVAHITQRDLAAAPDSLGWDRAVFHAPPSPAPPRPRSVVRVECGTGEVGGALLLGRLVEDDRGPVARELRHDAGLVYAVRAAPARGTKRFEVVTWTDPEHEDEVRSRLERALARLALGPSDRDIRRAVAAARLDDPDLDPRTAEPALREAARRILTPFPGAC